MSIYGSRRVPVYDDPHWQRLLVEGAGAQSKPPAQAVGSQPAEDFARLRKADPVNHLLPTSRKWLESLLNEARPVALASSYARIINNFAHQWNDPAACGAYFEALLVDRRGGRQGFPPAIQADIRKLLEYFLRSQL